ncbi:MAG: 50S ribosomal protein L4 [Alphaproteobacteria bacterium]|nr:50S ribosomal protein L4 [Alphaproteobacteria bacterium]
MKCDIITLENNKVGDYSLPEGIFGLPKRADILARMVNYQLAKRRQGTHKTRGISEVSGTTKKPWKQKGTGRARAGSLRAPQMRGGGIVFGPVVRSHAIDLPKKVRVLALKTALSVKAQEGSLVILENLDLASHKTKDLRDKLTKLGITSALVIGGEALPEAFANAASNIPLVDVLPQQGINVYDILRRKTLVLTQDAVKNLEERLA